jgi:hypothetical protein
MDMTSTALISTSAAASAAASPPAPRAGPAADRDDRTERERTDQADRAVHQPHFDAAVASGGYAWWYVDALSDDGQHGAVIIGFVGSVFSPYYAWARRPRAQHAPRALDHCAINVALYGPGRGRWAMTERGADRV